MKSWHELKKHGKLQRVNNYMNNHDCTDKLWEYYYDFCVTKDEESLDRFYRYLKNNNISTI